MNRELDCISYEPKSFEFLIPSPIIFSTLCLSYDKTELFIISFVRLVIYITLYYLISENLDLNIYPTINYFLIVMIFVNILYIGIVVSKKTIFSVNSDNSVYEKVIK